MEAGSSYSIKTPAAHLFSNKETGTSAPVSRVVRAFNEGDLYIRNLPRESGNDAEITLLNKREIFAVCATHMMRGGHTASFEEGRPVVVISDPRPLFFYKGEAFANFRDALRQGREIAHYIPPLSCKYSHLQKMREISQRYCSHYQEWTSGHLNENSTYSPRKEKTTDGYYGTRPEYNEILLENYQTENLAGIGSVDPHVIGDTFSCNWIKMLELHQEITSGVHGCPPLPLVFFQSSPTRLTSILSLEQEGYSAEQIIKQLKLVMDLAGANGLDINKLGKLLAMLPARSLLGKIMALDLPAISPHQSAAVELAKTLNLGGKSYWSSPEYHFPDLRDFQQLVHAGASFQRVISLPNGSPRTLIIFSLFEGTQGSIELADINRERKTMLTPEQYLAKAHEIENRIDEMIEAGLITPKLVTLDRWDFKDNPFAYIHLLTKGCCLNRFKHRFFPEITIALDHLPDKSRQDYIAKTISLIRSVSGWRLINETCKYEFGGCSYHLNTDASIYYISERLISIFESQADWFIKGVQTAFLLLENGAICEIKSPFKRALLAACQQEPEKFQSVYKSNAKQLLEYIERMNKQNRLIQSNDPPAENKPAPPLNADVDCLIQLFDREKPAVNEKVPLSEKIQTVLNTYYSAPGPAAAREHLRSKAPLPRRLRGLHDCDHAVRTALFSRIFLQFLQSCDPPSAHYLSKEPALPDLLPLAELYHDVVAEDEPKTQEEIQAALYLLRDLQDAYPNSLLLEVAVALANKNMRNSQNLERERQNILDQVPKSLIEQVSPELWAQLEARFFKPPSLNNSMTEKTADTNFQEWLLAVIRFGATVDFARCSGEQGFNRDFLPLPANMTFFDRCRMTSIVRACWNLAALTGGAPEGNSYYQLHGLRNPKSSEEVLQQRKIANHNQLIRETLSSHDNVWLAVRTELDRMARRTIARQANMPTARQGWHANALSNQPRYPLIYDEQDLDQVPLPPGLSELETLWISLGNFHNLSTERRAQVKECIEQLESTMIQHPMGTLTQKTITGAKSELRKIGLEARDDHFSFHGHPLTVKRLKVADTADKAATTHSRAATN